MTDVDYNPRIGELHLLLSSTDYIVIKHAEGREVEDYDAKIAQREAWREELRRLEQQ